MHWRIGESTESTDHLLGLSAVILGCFLLCLVSGLVWSATLCFGHVRAWWTHIWCTRTKAWYCNLPKGLLWSIHSILFLSVYSCTDLSCSSQRQFIGESPLGDRLLRGSTRHVNIWQQHLIPDPHRFAPDPPGSPQFSKCLSCCWP